MTVESCELWCISEACSRKGNREEEWSFYIRIDTIAHAKREPCALVSCMITFAHGRQSAVGACG